MSTFVQIATFDPGVFWRPVGFSEESRRTSGLADQYRTELRNPASAAWRGRLLGEIAEILDDCSTRGWDGYDAVPISADSVIAMVEILDNLPEGLQGPDVVPQPNGSLALEWQTDDRRMFALAATGQTIVYAGRFGGSATQYGQERFFGVIPQPVLEILTRYFASQ